VGRGPQRSAGGKKGRTDWTGEECGCPGRALGAGREKRGGTLVSREGESQRTGTAGLHKRLRKRGEKGWREDPTSLVQARGKKRINSLTEGVDGTTADRREKKKKAPARKGEECTWGSGRRTESGARGRKPRCQERLRERMGFHPGMLIPVEQNAEDMGLQTLG